MASGYLMSPLTKMRSLARSFGSLRIEESVSPFAATWRRFINSGNAKEQLEVVNYSRPSMNFVRGTIEENGRDVFGGSRLSRYHMEQNADIVHVKLRRNNSFVTVTDSKGNVKFKTSAGKLAEKGGKVTPYNAEAVAEHMGRKAQESQVKSVVVKVNGFTYFRKKKQAILSFREGYSHSRAGQNPIVYIEDTTRRPHNGCRLRKKCRK